ncbi:MAG TPA: DUF4129 domain-containing protein [Candidatus Saccharimonadales bacterium]|nr:DUF4129 domain-containing protein [Candidatus Saccharimonadales bacterium]
MSRAIVGRSGVNPSLVGRSGVNPSLVGRSGVNPSLVNPSLVNRMLVAGIPGLFAAVAEGAWIGIVYDLIQIARGEPVVLGPIGLSVAALLGLLVARVASDRLGPSWPPALVLLTFGAGAAGWLVSDPARAALLSGNVERALSQHQAGWLAGLAFLRGKAHARLAVSERTLARLLAWGTPGLAIPLFIGHSLLEPARTSFENRTIVEVLLFIVAGTIGLAMARLARLGAVAGFDWRSNRFWLVLLGVAALTTVVAVPAAFVVAPTVQLGVALLLPPLLVVALFAGIGTIRLRSIGIVLGVGLLAFIISRLGLAIRQQTPTQPGSGAAGNVGPSDATSTLLSWLPVFAIIVVVILVVARIWSRRRAEARLAPREERAIERSPAAEPARRPRRSLLHLPWGGREPPPTDAVEAYLAALADLERDPELGRRANESPARHARRLREAGSGSLEFELLAADYQLARFGGVPLTPGEQRRAIDRWRRLRGGLGR